MSSKQAAFLAVSYFSTGTTCKELSLKHAAISQYIFNAGTSLNNYFYPFRMDMAQNKKSTSPGWRPYIRFLVCARHLVWLGLLPLHRLAMECKSKAG